MIRALTEEEIATTEFAHLLWLAVEVDDAELDKIARHELPKLTIRGVVDRGRVVAFIGFDADADPLTIEYIAVDESARTRGHGAALIEDVRGHAGGRAVYAQTDDDAVDFYRRIGFAITERESDPRWPDRRRYNCLLEGQRLHPV
jgi:ribosomal protein S18 acetylase RimI-like enzyme